MGGSGDYAWLDGDGKRTTAALDMPAALEVAARELRRPGRDGVLVTRTADGEVLLKV